MQPKQPTVSVVMPTLNESRNLPLVLPYLPLDWIDEVILVDGRSTDDTVDIAHRLLPTIKVVMEHKPGKGAAMRAGFAAASGDILITMDADGSNDPREIPRFIQKLLEGADFVKGSRFAPGGGTTDMPRYRKWGNSALKSLVNFLFNSSYTDLCYGYHAFWRHCLPAIDGTIENGFEVDTAIYVRVLRERLRIVEVPSFEGYRFYGVGKLQTIPDGFRVLFTILHEWLNSCTARRHDPYRGFRGYEPKLQSGASPMTPVELIYNLSHELVARPTVHERLIWLLQRILTLIGATSGSLLILDDAGQVAEGVLAYRNQIHSPNTPQVVDVVERGLAGWVVEHRQAALIPSTANDARWLRRPWEEPNPLPRSALSIPFMLYDRPFGVLTLVHEDKDWFTQNDLALLTAITVGLSLSTAAFLLPKPPLSETKRDPDGDPSALNLDITSGHPASVSV
jgi:glycosyltransferase involved in cell wall biosynthesis